MIDSGVNDSPNPRLDLTFYFQLHFLVSFHQSVGNKLLNTNKFPRLRNPTRFAVRVAAHARGMCSFLVLFGRTADK